MPKSSPRVSRALLREGSLSSLSTFRGESINRKSDGNHIQEMSLAAVQFSKEFAGHLADPLSFDSAIEDNKRLFFQVSLWITLKNVIF